MAFMLGSHPSHTTTPKPRSTLEIGLAYGYNDADHPRLKRTRNGLREIINSLYKSCSVRNRVLYWHKEQLIRILDHYNG